MTIVRVEQDPDDEDFVIIPIPDEVLNQLGIGTGDKLEVTVADSSSIVLSPIKEPTPK